MPNAFKYKDLLLEWFYLESDDMTIRRNKDSSNGRFCENDIVVPFTLRGNNGYDYKGIHVPTAKTSVSLPWLLIVLRGIPFDNDSVLDHIDGDIHNNCRNNIRVVTQGINTKNRSKRSDNTSGHTGISWIKCAGMYAVRKTINGKRMYKSSKTLDGAILHLKKFEEMGLSDGYTVRHGK